VISLGSNTSVNLYQVLDLQACNDQTHSIAVYLEGISNAHRFMSALRVAANVKPVVVLTAGRKLAGHKAAQTHSGTIVGSHEVFHAAQRRATPRWCGAGAVRVRSFVKLFSASKCLASSQRPVGKRLAVVSNCCGPGVLAAGWLCEVGPTLGTFSAETITKLKPKLPAVASLHNQIDLFEEASTKHHRLAIDAAAHQKAFGVVLVLHPPKSGINAAKTAQAMARVKAGRLVKPLLCF
jgi:acetyltransferase